MRRKSTGRRHGGTGFARSEAALNRAPRLPVPPGQDELLVPVEPEKPTGFRFPWLTVLIPLVCGGVLYLVVPNAGYFLLVMLLGILSSDHCLAKEPPGPLAQKGILDLRNQDLSAKPMALDGEWGFFWKKLLLPDSLSTAGRPASIRGR